MTKGRKALLIAAGIGGVGLCLVAARWLVPNLNWRKSFDGDSGRLKHSVVVPTLDSPIPAGKNAIWCASFLASWKELQDLAGRSPVDLADAKTVSDSLNAARDPRSDLGSDSYFGAAGRLDDGVIERISAGLKERFPSKSAPKFRNITAESIVAYAYCEASVAFTLPFFENDEPLVFTNGFDAARKLKSFGIRSKDDYAYRPLRKQVRVLHREGDRHPAEFIVDLCAESAPNQIILACIPRAETLEATIESAMKKIHQGNNRSVGPNDTLLVPNIIWHITHRVPEVAGRTIAGPAGLAGLRIEEAVQEIQFRLDRSGARLKSESKLIMKPVPTHYRFDRPFLILMQKRGTDRPFFVMWVANSELLQKW